MSLVDDFILAANDEMDDAFGTTSMVCNGQTFDVVINSERKSYEGALGGLESEVQAVATAQPGDVSNPRGMLQKRAVVGGVNYRVAEVSVGVVAIDFVLADPGDSR